MRTSRNVCENRDSEWLTQCLKALLTLLKVIDKVENTYKERKLLSDLANLIKESGAVSSHGQLNHYS